MKKILFDMDGVLAKWEYVPMEVVAKKGYFENRPAMTNVVNAVKTLIKNGVEVGILSAVLKDDHSTDEKLRWLGTYIPEIPSSNIFFAVYGKPKALYVPDEWQDAVLVDDLTLNLNEWSAYGYGRVAIKMYNGINGTKGTWEGFSVHSNQKPSVMAMQIMGILNVA